jgi:protein-disulfide isomerase
MMRMAKLCAAAATAALLSAAAPAPASAADGTMSPENRAAIENIVRDYILSNPEIIMEAVERLRAKQRMAEESADRQALESNRAALLADPNSHVGGNPKGDVTIVEFFDYRCGVCKRIHPIVEELVRSDGNIRRIYKEWPILGPDSVIASRAAIASRAQGKYPEFHKAMMEAKAALDEARILQIAASVGLDTARLRKDMDSPAVEKVIAANYALADKLKLNGTPSFLIGDRLLRGGRDLESLRAIVAEARADAKKRK